jgi:hypothetical protein
MSVEPAGGLGQTNCKGRTMTARIRREESFVMLGCTSRTPMPTTGNLASLPDCKSGAPSSTVGSNPTGGTKKSNADVVKLASQETLNLHVLGSNPGVSTEKLNNRYVAQLGRASVCGAEGPGSIPGYLINHEPRLTERGSPRNRLLTTEVRGSEPLIAFVDSRASPRLRLCEGINDQLAQTP